MDKTTLVVEVMNLCDENETLKRDLERNQRPAVSNGEKLSEIEKYALYIGRKAMFEDVCDYWGSVNKSDDEETGQTTYETFEHWFERVTKGNKIPSIFSRKEFKEFVTDAAREQYDEELKKAQAED